MLLPAAGGHDQHGALARETTLAVAVAPAPVAVLADAVREAVGVDPVDPALQDRR